MYEVHKPSVPTLQDKSAVVQSAPLNGQYPPQQQNWQGYQPEQPYQPQQPASYPPPQAAPQGPWPPDQYPPMQPPRPQYQPPTQPQYQQPQFAPQQPQYQPPAQPQFATQQPQYQPPQPQYQPPPPVYAPPPPAYAAYQSQQPAPAADPQIPGLEWLGISQPRMPEHEVVFQLPGGGRLKSRFHAVHTHENMLLLVFDNRSPYGRVQPPATHGQSQPLVVELSDGRRISAHFVENFSVTMGPLDLLVLVIVSDTDPK